MWSRQTNKRCDKNMYDAIKNILRPIIRTVLYERHGDNSRYRPKLTT